MSKYFKYEDVYALVTSIIVFNYDRETIKEEFAKMPTIEVSEDCISRANAIKIIERIKAEVSDSKKPQPMPITIIEWAIEDIKNAPSVVPNRAEGEWQITDAYPHNVYCSECHKKFAQTHWGVWEDGSLPRNYCPNCGAKMKGAE